jgi:thiamine biosynthesis lipoprotein
MIYIQYADYYDRTDYGMGTIIEQKVATSSLKISKEICNKVTESLKKLEKDISYFIPDSYVSQINNSGGKREIIVNSNTRDILTVAHKYYLLSNGAFDITAAPLTALWRVSIGEKTVPIESSILDLIPYISGDGIVVDDKNQKVRIKKGQSIDLGGIGKGYAADIAINLYRTNGISSAFINLGGNVHTLGSKTNGERWMIGLQNPRSFRGDYIAVIAISDMSIVTSGDYEKYFINGDKRYHHIIDPRTGYPADSDLLSATIVSPASIEADALSTAVFVLGLERGMELIQKTDQAEGILITKKKEVFVTKGLEKSFFVQNKSMDYKFYYYS